MTSLDQFIAAGGPATNAAVTCAALQRAAPGCVAGDEWKTELFTATGRDIAAKIISDDLERQGVRVTDCTGEDHLAGDADLTPAVSSIFVSARTGSRTLASTNSRLPLDTAPLVEARCGGGTGRDADGDQWRPRVLLVDGHNPALAAAALATATLDTDRDPFAAIDTKPPYLRILDGGSWKPWLPPMLPFIDVAIISADFRAPGARDVEDTVAFLRGFGIERVIQTHGGDATRWWWCDTTGEAMPPQVDTRCTLAAGDVFHGAFAYACARGWVDRATTSPARAVRFANEVASLSTTVFGTRAWLADPRVRDIVTQF